jgi:ribosomal protein S18 acetylase RimI-like enzyme
MMATTIRKARLEDAAGIAIVHVDSWRSTYKDLLAAELLATLSYERRNQGWRDLLSNPQNNSFVYVSENESGKITGFISAGLERESEPDFKGEVYAIYLLEKEQGKGTGRKLMQAAIRELCRGGITSMLLWVLKDNLPSRRFYEAMGGRYLREKPITIGNQTKIEVAYGWKNLSSMFPESSGC